MLAIDAGRPPVVDRNSCPDVDARCRTFADDPAVGAVAWRALGAHADRSHPEQRGHHVSQSRGMSARVHAASQLTLVDIHHRGAIDDHDTWA